MKNKFVLFNLIVFISAFLLMGITWYWMIFPIGEPVTVNKTEVLTKQVKAGDDLLYKVYFCINYKAPTTITRSIQDGVIYYLPTHTNSFELGCTAHTKEVTIPKNISPGFYFINHHVVVKLNPVRDYSMEYNTELFEVVK